MTLDELIAMGKHLHETDVNEISQPGIFGYNVGTGYKTWMNDCLNFLEEKYPSHRMTKDFTNYKKKAESGWSDTFDDMIAILNSLKNIKVKNTSGEENMIEEIKKDKKTIFISHSSSDEGYGKALYKLFVALGIPKENIFFSSMITAGISAGEDILERLKKELSIKPIVFFLISNNFYKSPYCCCELGASWILELTQHIVFLPKMDSENAFKGTISPLKKGIDIKKEGEIGQICSILNKEFSLDNNYSDISEAIKDFYTNIEAYENTPAVRNHRRNIFVTCSTTDYVRTHKEIDIKSSRKSYSKFLKVHKDGLLHDIEYIAILEEADVYSDYVIKTYCKVKHKKDTVFEITGSIESLEVSTPILTGKEVKNERLFSLDEILRNDIYNL